MRSLAAWLVFGCFDTNLCNDAKHELLELLTRYDKSPDNAGAELEELLEAYQKEKDAHSKTMAEIPGNAAPYQNH